MPETNVGGWTGFRFNISAEDQKVFDEAFAGFTGATYTPLAVATQPVNGINYCFLCKGEIVYPDAPQFAAKVYIFQPRDGAAHITEIVRVNPS